MIVRAPRPESNFYTLNKAVSEDKRLSWAARGLLIFLLGKPDHWTIMPSALVAEVSGTRTPTGRDGTYALLKELLDVGYIQRAQERSPGGELGQVRYLVHESPLPAQADTAPLPAQPETAQPYPANPTRVSIDGEQGQIHSKDRATAGASAKAVTMERQEDGLFRLQVPAEKLEAYAKAYPTLNLQAEIAKAEAWINENLSRRPRSLYGRFLTSWLGRADSRRLRANLTVVGGSRADQQFERRKAFADAMRPGAPINTEQPRGSNVIDVDSREVG